MGRWRQLFVQTPIREGGPDPDTVLQEARRRVVSLEAEGEASSPNTSIEGVACTE